MQQYALILLCCVWFSGFWPLAAQNLWNRSYGNGYTDGGTSVLVTPDQHILAIGTSTQEETRIQWLKTDSFGEMVARKFFGGPGITWANDAALFPADSGVVVCGSRFVDGPQQYDQYVARLNALGDTLWTRSFGGEDWDVAHWISVDSLGFIHVAGQGFSTLTGLGEAIWTVFSPDGTLLIQKIWSVPNANLNPIHAMALPEGGWLLGGEVSPGPAGGQDIWAVKLDSALHILWSRSYGTPGEDRLGNVSIYRNSANAITYTLGGDFSLPGQTQGFMFLQRITTSGDSILRVDAAQGGGLLFSRKKCRHVYQGVDGVYSVMCQSSNSDESQSWNVEFSQTSFLFWQSGQILFVGSQYKAADFVPWPSGGFVLTGETDFYGPGVRALFLSKVGPGGEGANAVVVGQDEQDSDILLPYPNPTTSAILIQTEAQIDWQTFDLTGRLVHPHYAWDGTAWKLQFDGLPVGWYRVTGRAGDGRRFSFGVLFQGN